MRLTVSLTPYLLIEPLSSAYFLSCVSLISACCPALCPAGFHLSWKMLSGMICGLTSVAKRGAEDEWVLFARLALFSASRAGCGADNS